MHKSIYSVPVWLVLVSLLLSACLPASASPDAPGKRKVEVFSWWTGGGEAAGLDAMIKVFSEKYPDIEFINAAVAGGAGINARAVLATRLQANDPPDSWQGHAGQELIGTYVKANQLESLNFLYEENKWLSSRFRLPAIRSTRMWPTGWGSVCRRRFGYGLN